LKGLLTRAGVKVEDSIKDDEAIAIELQDPLDNKSKPQVKQIRKLIESYMKIIIKNVRDIVPKVIIMMMINNLTEFLEKELVGQIYSHTDLVKFSNKSLLALIP
jgi:dynamin 1/3